MAGVGAAAVRNRQQVPRCPVEVMVDHAALRLDPAGGTRARARPRRSRRPHSEARRVFAREIVDALTRQLAARLGANVLAEGNLLDRGDVDELRRELRGDPEVRALIERLWPVLTPQRLLADLFTSAGRLAAAAPRLSAPE